jgi:hypothetical protein
MFHMSLTPAEIFRFRVEWLANEQMSLMFFQSISFNIMSIVTPRVAKQTPQGATDLAKRDERRWANRSIEVLPMRSLMASERINAQPR